MVETVGERITRAAGNAWAVTFGDGIEKHEPYPSTVLFDEPHRLLRRFDSPKASGVPVLLVPPLAVAPNCFDLRPGQSLVAHLVATGRPVYLLDFGHVGFAQRTMGFEDFVDDIIPTALARVAQDAGSDIDIVTWSLGGTLSLLTAAANAGLPLRSITALGTPIDYSKNPATVGARRLGRITGGNLIPAVNRVTGGPAGPIVQAGFRVLALKREVTRPLYIARNILDEQALARMQAIENFIDAMPGYPGRLYNQMYTRLIIRNELAKGQVHLGSRVIDLAKVSVPVLAVGSPADNIAPLACVQAIEDVLTGAPSLRFETVKASHLGLVAGPDAATVTWPLIDSFLSELDSA